MLPLRSTRHTWEEQVYLRKNGANELVGHDVVTAINTLSKLLCLRV